MVIWGIIIILCMCDVEVTCDYNSKIYLYLLHVDDKY